MNLADPFAEFRRLHEYMEEMRRRFLGSPGQPQFCPPILEPPVNVCETDDSVIVLAEMPGVNLHTLHIHVPAGTIPKDNEADLKEVAEDVRREMTVVLAERVDKVLKEALYPAPVEPYVVLG